MKIKLTSVFVNDPAEAFRIYTEKLGFVKRYFQPEAGIAIVASPEETNGTGLMLEPNSNPIAKTYQAALFNSSIPVIVFSVADIHSEYKRLKDHGIVFRTNPVKNEWGTQAIFEDGCGNLIQLHEEKGR
jgi:predicted enzyme related to lactoylglutathione lyase